jgi:flagellar protein FliO/FliZ
MDKLSSWALLFFCSCSTGAYAREIGSYVVPMNRIVEGVLVLFVVLGIFLVGANVFRRISGMRTEPGSIRFLGGITVGNRQRVVLLEAQGCRVLLAVSPGRIDTIHSFEKGGCPKLTEMSASDSKERSQCTE